MDHPEHIAPPPLGSSYGFHCVLRNVGFDTRVTAALKAEGFGVLTDIDVQATMKSKLGVDIPAIASSGLVAEPDIGLLLPCNVVVRQESADRLVVGFMDPVAIMQTTSNLEVAKVAREVRQRLERVRSALTA